jgi:hypothetical protein
LSVIMLIVGDDYDWPEVARAANGHAGHSSATE